ncbi:hypothetical protein HCH_05633 [Hahella chejuensis KCTC 2396]|uniref:Uncharacterized protein n=1 Tax=Hahella chejuensis (strain KCTC 2396) TaxID=349521 RepID=Q2SAN3_HAHCH|nr:hypothetical protein [Hahella chejuensis]ABC32291.1 hypothetical protein HCH_05633 [Hahella chejuensis KCTC 2396]
MKKLINTLGVGLLCSLSMQAMAGEGHAKTYIGFTNATSETLHFELSSSGVVVDEVTLLPGTGYKSKEADSFLSYPGQSSASKRVEFASFVKKGKKENHHVDLVVRNDEGRIIGIYQQDLQFIRDKESAFESTNRYAECHLKNETLEFFKDHFEGWNVFSDYRQSIDCVLYLKFY